jgi:hypothetical protein
MTQQHSNTASAISFLGLWLCDGGAAFGRFVFLGRNDWNEADAFALNPVQSPKAGVLEHEVRHSIRCDPRSRTRHTKLACDKDSAKRVVDGV